MDVIGSFVIPANERRTKNLLANRKRTVVDRLFWNFSKEVYFLCFLTGDEARHGNRRFRILKSENIQNSEDIINEKL